MYPQECGNIILTWFCRLQHDTAGIFLGYTGATSVPNQTDTQIAIRVFSNTEMLIGEEGALVSSGTRGIVHFKEPEVLALFLSDWEVR